MHLSTYNVAKLFFLASRFHSNRGERYLEDKRKAIGVLHKPKNNYPWTHSNIASPSIPLHGVNLLTSHTVCSGDSISWHRLGRSSGQFTSSPLLAIMLITRPTVARINGDSLPIQCRLSFLMYSFTWSGNLQPTNILLTQTITPLVVLTWGSTPWRCSWE